MTDPRFTDAVRPGAVIVFGEMHGTAEVPAFVGGEPAVHEMMRSRRAAHAREVGVAMFDQPDEHGYDGGLYVGTITASRPAR